MSEVNKLLKEHGAALVRQKKHKVYRFPDGRIFVMANSASDFRAEANNLSDLKKLLGLQKQARCDGQRRERKEKPGNQSAPSIRKTFAEQLEPIRERLEADDLREELASTLSELEALERLWVVRLYRWANSVVKDYLTTEPFEVKSASAKTNGITNLQFGTGIQGAAGKEPTP